MFKFQVDQNGTKAKSSDNDGIYGSTSQENEKENTKRKDLMQESKTEKPKVKFVVIVFDSYLANRGSKWTWKVGLLKSNGVDV